MIRPPLPSDQGYIAATWFKSVMSMSHFRQRHLSTGEGRALNAQIDAVLDRPDTRGVLLVKDSNHDYIIGWLVYVDGPTVPVVHYLYCREYDDKGHRLRGNRVSEVLLAKIGVDHSKSVVCTSYGPASRSMRSRYKQSVHLPLEEFLKP